ncbi:hypothetical protein [Desulfurispira natronophila]|uniref:Uncharacterized protein n=1 Tax=Desulfurispira natronophila TaxID=682562 RepID=A0A7W7Y5V0_9BACT|nr:hypothetical protein [Desulfurispira natronophila]MBB5022641.1 hypothetical protein [Desulfurispira natronophila]
MLLFQEAHKVAFSGLPFSTRHGLFAVVSSSSLHRLHDGAFMYSSPYKLAAELFFIRCASWDDTSFHQGMCWCYALVISSGCRIPGYFASVAVSVRAEQTCVATAQVKKKVVLL